MELADIKKLLKKRRRNMKKYRLVSLILVVLSIFAFTACKSEVKTESVETVENETSTKKFVVGFDAEYPPYGYMAEDGSYTGFDLDLAKEFCNRAGYEFVAQPIDWDSKDLELNSGNIDCIWNGFTITGREDDYTWTFPYVDNSIVLIVNNDSDIYTKADLAGKVVMAQAGSTGLTALTEDEANKEFASTFASLEQCADYNSAFMNLESGVIDCISVDIGVAKYQLNNSGGKFRQLDDVVSKEQYAIGFKKGNTELRNEVEKVLSSMWKDGTFSKIANKYVDFALPSMICIGDYVE